jgi:hypothetical protein
MVQLATLNRKCVHAAGTGRILQLDAVTHWVTLSRFS